MPFPPQSPHAADPNQARRLYWQGLEHLRSDRLEAARDTLLEALRLDKGMAEARVELGNCYRRLGRVADAEAAYLEAVSQKPGSPAPWFGLAYLYRDTGRTSDAVSCLGEVCRHFASDTRVLHEAGGLLADFGSYEEAALVYETILARGPVAKSYLRLGQFRQKLGQFDAAAAAYTRAIELDPALGPAYMLLANTRHMQPCDRPLVERFTAALRERDMDDTSKACVHFGAGKLHDDWQEFDAAFEHMRRANELRSQAFKFDRVAWTGLVRNVVNTFRMIEPSAPPPDGRRPMPSYVVGMLRSGTTLVDRLLSNHPRVRSLGETELLDAFVKRLATLGAIPYPDYILHMEDRERTIAAASLRRLATMGHDTALYVLDKNPLNFIYVGVLRLLLPAAPIIHCRRDPLDTCLSIYFQNFAHPRIDFAYTLDDIAAYYAGYENLMAFWETWSPGSILSVNYESLVTEPERVMRGLYASLGLAWQPQAIQPEANPATIATASLWQARQPMYTHSVGRWRHYEKHLQPLQDALERYRAEYQSA